MRPAHPVWPQRYDAAVPLPFTAAYVGRSSEESEEEPVDGDDGSDDEYLRRHKLPTL